MFYSGGSGLCLLIPEPPKGQENRSSLDLVNTLKEIASFSTQLTSLGFQLVFSLNILYFCARALMHFVQHFRLFSAERLVRVLSSPCRWKRMFTLVSDGNISKEHYPLF